MQQLVNRFGQAGSRFGGVLLVVAYLDAGLRRRLVACAASRSRAIGLGFYMLHNTLQTNATQMTPEARGTAVAIFSSAIYLGQTLGVAAGALVFDRLRRVPLFTATAVALPALAWWFARKTPTTDGGAWTTKDERWKTLIKARTLKSDITSAACTGAGAGI